MLQHIENVYKVAPNCSTALHHSCLAKPARSTPQPRKQRASSVVFHCYKAAAKRRPKAKARATTGSPRRRAKAKANATNSTRSPTPTIGEYAPEEAMIAVESPVGGGSIASESPFCGGSTAVTGGIPFALHPNEIVCGWCSGTCEREKVA